MQLCCRITFHLPVNSSRSNHFHIHTHIHYIHTYITFNIFTFTFTFTCTRPSIMFVQTRNENNALVRLHRQIFASSACNHQSIHPSIPSSSIHPSIHPSIHRLTSPQPPPPPTHQSPQDEEDHEDATEDGLAINVPVSDRRHGNQGEVHAVPVRQVLFVSEVFEWIPGVFHLEGTWSVKFREIIITTTTTTTMIIKQQQQ